MTPKTLCPEHAAMLRQMVREREDDTAYFRADGPTPMPDVVEWHRIRADALRAAISALDLEEG